MKVARTSMVLSVLLGLVWTVLPAEEEAAPKAQLKLPKKPVSYVVKRTVKAEFRETVSNSTSEVVYKVSAGETRDDGNLVIEVAYASLKGKSDSERWGYEFDSSKKDDQSELATAVREAIAGPITVYIANGDIVRVKGFPSYEQSDDREVRGRQFRVRRLASEDLLRGDLELILGLAVQGKALEKGKSYRIEREDVERLSGDGDGRRRFRGFGLSDVVFKYEEAQKNRGKFSLTTAPRGEREGVERQESSTGEAIVSLRNGTLSRLSLDTKSEFSGSDFSYKRTSQLTIQRQRANRDGGEKDAAGAAKKAGDKKKSDRKTDDL